MPTVLVVESPILYSLIRSILVNEGFRVLLASEATFMRHVKQADVVVTDDEEVAFVSLCCGLGLVMLLEGQENASHNNRPGDWQFISKPFVPTELVTAVQRALGHPAT